MSKYNGWQLVSETIEFNLSKELIK